MRIMMLTTIAAASLLAPAGAQEGVQRAPGEPTRMICKKFEATGTRLGTRRVCATADEWAQRESQDQATMRALQQRGRLESEGHRTSGIANLTRGI